MVEPAMEKIGDDGNTEAGKKGSRKTMAQGERLWRKQHQMKNSGVQQKKRPTILGIRNLTHEGKVGSSCATCCNRAVGDGKPRSCHMQEKQKKDRNKDDTWRDRNGWIIVDQTVETRTTECSLRLQLQRILSQKNHSLQRIKFQAQVFN